MVPGLPNSGQSLVRLQALDRVLVGCRQFQIDAAEESSVICEVRGLELGVWLGGMREILCTLRTWGAAPIIRCRHQKQGRCIGI